MCETLENKQRDRQIVAPNVQQNDVQQTHVVLMQERTAAGVFCSKLLHCLVTAESPYH